jgi:hypothetical protein
MPGGLVPQYVTPNDSRGSWIQGSALTACRLRELLSNRSVLQ